MNLASDQDLSPCICVCLAVDEADYMCKRLRISSKVRNRLGLWCTFVR